MINDIRLIGEKDEIDLGLPKKLCESKKVRLGI